MDLTELRTIITNSGGGSFALAGAEGLLAKINRLEDEDDFRRLLTQFKSSKDPGDLRGRILEINFAYLFLEKKEKLLYGQKQGMSGDIDFLWKFEKFKIYIEMKLLRQDRDTLEQINVQLERGNFFGASMNDLKDIARIQRDIFLKSSTKKFNSNPEQNAINLVAIDISELQGGMVDLHDCLLVAGGNNAVSSLYKRNGVVGLFESIPVNPSEEQKKWLTKIHKIENGDAHPRNYIHGVLFLFRTPQETSALTYDLKSVICINNSIVTDWDKIFDRLTTICPRYEGSTIDC